MLQSSNEISELQFQMMNEADRLHSFIDRRIPNSLQNRLSADDILQEVWLAAFHGYSDFRALQADSIERWLTRIAERKLLDALKRVRRLKRGGRHRVDLSLSRQQSSHIELLSLITSNQRTPSSEVAAREATHAVQIAINALPDKYRQAITLCHLDGYSHEEAAKVMRKSVASIHSLIYRAKLKLGQKLGHSDRFFNNYS